jgi:hypothetical protein
MYLVVASAFLGALQIDTSIDIYNAEKGGRKRERERTREERKNERREKREERREKREWGAGGGGGGVYKLQVPPNAQ